jgi:hypothetical protein
LLLGEGQQAVKFMIPTRKFPTAGANWRGLTRQIS